MNTRSLPSHLSMVKHDGLVCEWSIAMYVCMYVCMSPVSLSVCAAVSFSGGVHQWYSF